MIQVACKLGKMWRKVTGEAPGTHTVRETFFFRRLFSREMEGLLFSIYLQHQCLYEDLSP